MGFEPMKHFWRLHAFQACLFNHSSISPYILLLYISSLRTSLGALHLTVFSMFPSQSSTVSSTNLMHFTQVGTIYG